MAILDKEKVLDGFWFRQDISELRDYAQRVYNEFSTDQPNDRYIRQVASHYLPRDPEQVLPSVKDELAKARLPIPPDEVIVAEVQRFNGTARLTSRIEMPVVLHLAQEIRASSRPNDDLPPTLLPPQLPVAMSSLVIQIEARRNLLH